MSFHTSHTAGHYSISRATTLEEVEAIRDSWESLQCHPNSDIDHYLNLLNARCRIIRPHIIVVTQDGRPLSMAIGRIENSSLNLKLGYRRIWSPVIRSLAVIYGGVLGSQSPEVAEVLFRELMLPLEHGDVDLVRFDYLALDSPLYGLVSTRPTFLSRDRLPTVNTHWRMKMPESLEEFMRARFRKHQGWLRRNERLLAKDYEGQVKYLCHRGDKALDKALADAEYVAQRTYQRDLHVGFVDNEETRKIYSLLAEKDRLRVYVAYVNGVPGAFWLGELYGQTLFLYSTAFDPTFKQYGLGTVLFLKMLDDLVKVGGVQFVDFGFGDAPYKSKFGDHSTQEASINVFATTLSGVRTNAVRTLVLGAHRGALRLLDQFKAVESIKEGWRRKLKTTSGDAQGPE